MCQEEMDYRFGWRWLLPAVEGSMRIYGFSDEEEQFWRRISSDFGWNARVDQSDILLVNADQCVTKTDLHAAGLVCVIGNRITIKYWRTILDKTFPLVREYSLLPPNNPRVIVPLSSARHTVTALSLHRPGRWIARLGLLLARVLAFFGNFWLLRGRVLLIATRSTGFIPRGALQAGLLGRFGQRIDYALYLGTPDDNRKTIVLPLADSSPNMILKVAGTPKSRASLKNEAAALSALSQSILSGFVPKLEDLISSDAALTLYQEYRPRQLVSQRKLNADIVNFLGQLTALNHQSMLLSEYLQVLSGDSDECESDDVVRACRALRERLQNQAELDAEILLHRTHGDFAPWNCAWTNQGLFVFDWEESAEDGLALQDAFYYVIAPALLVQRNVSAIETLSAVFCFANRVIEASGMKLDIRIYLALWLLTRAGRAKLYGELCVLLARRWS